MSDKKKSAGGGSLISRRRMLHYGLAGMAGLAGFWPVSALGETNVMSGMQTGDRSTLTISKQTGDICFTYETLAMIRQNLLEVLKQQEPSDDYAYLVAEIETGNAQPIIFADSAHIGRWKLIHRNDTLLLEAQQIQDNTPIRLIYTAPLEWQEGQWKVSSVYIRTVEGR